LIAAGTAYGIVQYRLAGSGTGTISINGSPGPSGTGPPPVGPCINDVCNYLLLGSDSRAGLTPAQQIAFGTNADIGGSNRADTIMLVHTDPKLQKAIILSFPRDLLVDIPGMGQGKINSAFEGGVNGGGPQRMIQVIHNLTGLTINHVLYVDLAGFQGVVDTLGGVTMCISGENVNTPGNVSTPTATGGIAMVYYPEVGHIVDPNTGLDVKPGCQRTGRPPGAGLRALPAPAAATPRRPTSTGSAASSSSSAPCSTACCNPRSSLKVPGQLIGPILSSMRRDDSSTSRTSSIWWARSRGSAPGAVEFRSVPSYVTSSTSPRARTRATSRSRGDLQSDPPGQAPGQRRATSGYTPPSPARSRCPSSTTARARRRRTSADPVRQRVQHRQAASSMPRPTARRSPAT
jgi:LCP family protein required for cell wall assembly